MTARKKVVYHGPVEDARLRRTIHSLQLTENVREAILKDVHLVEAAFATEQTIASLDEVVRAHLRQISGSVRSLKSLVWVNPAKDEELSIDWLREGAQAEENRKLGFTT